MSIKINKSLILNKIKLHYKFKTDKDFADFLGISPQGLASWYSRNTFDFELLYSKCVDISADFILSGTEPMLKSDNTDKTDGKRNIIRLHSDVITMGGSSIAANGTSAAVEYIDAGDWFVGATDAIRHYGDSMVEYPSGCILALKQIFDFVNGFIWGQNYVVEYGDDYNRVTKRVQKEGKKIIAYSTNEETYKNGTPIHQPIDLVKIHRAWRVLGYVVKTESTTGVIKVG